MDGACPQSEARRPQRGKESRMSQSNLVVARYQNGTVVKGSTSDFYPDHALFHILVRGGASTVPVKMADLKALFFVKDLLGNPAHQKAREFGPIDPSLSQGKRVAILFKDGELLLGYTLSYTAGRQGFWLTPVDPNGNNTRVYVLCGAAKQIKVGPAAEELAANAPKPAPKAHRAA
jgi:hypothetical protein